MRIGLFAGATAATGNSLPDIVEFSKNAEAKGFDTIWLANIFGLDAVTTLAICGWETERIEFGTAVTPTYPRHPTALAQQAVTTNIACEGRFTLGIGLSHKMVIEDMLGMSYAKPASHMNEYLQIINPLLKGEGADFQGKEYSSKVALDIPGATPVPLLVAALGPKMLEIAGTFADGTTTWVTGPRTLEDHIIPVISKAAEAAGKAAPRIVAGLPVAVTNDVEGAKAQVAKSLQIYGMLPSYRAMLDREGAAGPEDVALIGDEATVRAGIARLRDLGVTDFNAAITPTDDTVFDATIAVLADELR
ncbi:MAG: TIGR03564 family F420-dependent LLM class oxidoreductase [Halioglobus sp.]